MRPNLGSTVGSWAWKSLVFWSETVVQVDFEPELVKENQRTLRLMVQPANPSDVQVDVIDWNLEHQLVHSRADFSMGELFKYKGKIYKIIQVDLWTDYGFTEGIAEEQRGRTD